MRLFGFVALAVALAGLTYSAMATPVTDHNLVVVAVAPTAHASPGENFAITTPVVTNLASQAVEQFASETFMVITAPVPRKEGTATSPLIVVGPGVKSDGLTASNGHRGGSACADTLKYPICAC